MNLIQNDRFNSLETDKAILKELREDGIRTYLIIFIFTVVSISVFC